MIALCIYRRGNRFSKVKQLSRSWAQVFMVSDPMSFPVYHVGKSALCSKYGNFPLIHFPLLELHQQSRVTLPLFLVISRLN